jgi:CRP-like cAMP-binding protein
MVSPEVLRRHPFFGFLTDAELRSVAMLSEEVALASGESLFEPESTAGALYLLTEGQIDLVYVVIDRDDPRQRKEFHVGECGPGDIVGISALIEPHIYTTAARATTACELVKFDGEGLRALGESDTGLAYRMMKETAKLALRRLEEAHVQLAACWG